MTRFVADEALAYDRLRTVFADGSGLTLDEAYRRAHLPLVAPGHRDAIAEDAGRGYRMGRHEIAWSLVIPTPWEQLAESAGLREMERALRASPLAGKIAWEMAASRRHVLHATICGGLGQGAAPDRIALLQALSGSPRFRVQLRGLFSGNINLGRLYLRLYPEEIAGTSAIHRIQDRLGRPRTDLYVAGLHNLTDHLDPAETVWLARFLDEHWICDIAEMTVEALWLLGARDDLALDSEVAEKLSLG